jgi:hypothetical protein
MLNRRCCNSIIVAPRRGGIAKPEFVGQAVRIAVPRGVSWLATPRCFFLTYTLYPRCGIMYIMQIIPFPHKKALTMRAEHGKLLLERGGQAAAYEAASRGRVLCSQGTHAPSLSSVYVLRRWSRLRFLADALRVGPTPSIATPTAHLMLPAATASTASQRASHAPAIRPASPASPER